MSASPVIPACVVASAVVTLLRLLTSLSFGTLTLLLRLLAILPPLTPVIALVVIIAAILTLVLASFLAGLLGFGVVAL